MKSLRLHWQLHLNWWAKAVIQIITIEREYGCGAAGIAKQLALRIGWELWDERLTQEIARLAHCAQSEVKVHEECRDPLYYRLLKSFTLGSYEGNSMIVPVDSLDADSIVRLSESVVEQAATGGSSVIVGRGSQHFLRERNDTLRIFLYGSREKKIRRLVSEGRKEADARWLVDTVDRERAAFIKNYFHADWPNRSIYHAMFNTDSGEELVVQAILSFQQQSQSIGIAAD